ncbi:MAG: PEP-CTERM sorting domain-containing protein [Candidatus Tectomicrobia bacterium]|uniref:PEP-CTERM sorting domain-containing protein n=1 Tax=Tectimicrobiota bacterium TaxID=2528274 RepID=A0A932G0Y0_UNCTE|nr:PEP-CTERM sorting domain-containing protein [Candidatus Tectomicrobia bacterium]
MPAVSWALSFDYVKTSVSGGFRYNFTLDNDLGTDLFEVFLDLPVAEGNLSDFLSPMGWGDGFGGSLPLFGPVTANSSFIEWFSELGSELPSGSSLTGFSFVSALEIAGPIRFSVNSNPNLGGLSSNSQPAPIPEPTTLVLMASGLAGMGYLRRRIFPSKTTPPRS